MQVPDIEPHDDAMDKIVNRLDVCQWHPLKDTDAMDKVISSDFEIRVQVETTPVTNSTPAIQVEMKRCFIKLVRLDSILLDNTTDADDSKHEENVTNKTTTPPVIQSRLRPRRMHDREQHDTQDKPVLTWNTMNRHQYH